MDKVVSLCKRRGTIFQSSEIYGARGPVGTTGRSVRSRADLVGLDSPILMHPRVWKASGHLDDFSDPVVDSRACKKHVGRDKNHVWIQFCEVTKGSQFNIHRGAACESCGKKRVLSGLRQLDSDTCLIFDYPSPTTNACVASPHLK